MSKQPHVIQCPNCVHRYLNFVEKCSQCGTPNPELSAPTRAQEWDFRFLQAALMFAGWSKDPSTKVGAVVVDEKRRIIGQGYNGFPRGVKDTDDRLNNREVKYAFTAHAELNALINSTLPPAGATLYCFPLPPCNECAKAIIQWGIKRVVAAYDADGVNRATWLETFKKTSLVMFQEAGVDVELYEIVEGQLRSMRIES